jgi:hypothetical protein
MPCDRLCLSVNNSSCDAEWNGPTAVQFNCIPDVWLRACRSCAVHLTHSPPAQSVHPLGIMHSPALCLALPTCRYLVEQLNKYGLAYVHMVEDRVTGNDDKEQTSNSLEPFRKVGRLRPRSAVAVHFVAPTERISTRWQRFKPGRKENMCVAVGVWCP